MRQRHVLSAGAIFAFAFAVRWLYLCGPILGDDDQELHVLVYILGQGPDLRDQLHLRFGAWILNWLCFRLFGISEITFLLPTWIVSSLMGVAAYALLVLWRYPALSALLGGLFVASAPFEVVTGTLRANDLYLAAALVLGLLLAVGLERRPVAQGMGFAACLWFGFYVKLWAVYALPALALYYLVRLRQPFARQSAVAFLATSAVLHGATCVLWWARLGTFVPFLTKHAATFPVERSDLARVLALYPRMILQGTEFGTTLFGALPYLLGALLAVKVVTTVVLRRPSPLRLDGADATLLVLYGSLFLLLNFFPNAFAFDRYYSVPRIFRYLTPISFPMALHAAKMLLDVARVFPGGRAPAAAVLLVVPAIVLNLRQADDATRPGRIYRSALRAVARDVRRAKPPKLVAEGVIASRFRAFKLAAPATEVPLITDAFTAPEHEAWLRRHQDALPPGAMLVTGLVSYVHYGATGGGFRLRHFGAPLDPRWQLVREYGLLSYMPDPEPARLWRLAGP